MQDSPLTTGSTVASSTRHDDVAHNFGEISVGKTIGEGTFGKVKKGTHKLTGIQVGAISATCQHSRTTQLQNCACVALYDLLAWNSQNSRHVNEGVSGKLI